MIKNIIIVLLILFLIYFIRHNIGLKRAYDDAQTTAQVGKQDIRDITANHQKIVTEQATIQFNDKNFIRKLSDSIFDLKIKEIVKIKTVKSYITVAQKMQIFDKEIPYTDTASYAITDSICDSLRENSARFILPPKRFEYKDSSLRIIGVVQLHGITIDSFKLTNKIALRVIDKKRGLFRSPMAMVQAINTNPNVSITGMQSVVLVQRPSAWSRWIKPLLFGIGGAYLGNKLLR